MKKNMTEWLKNPYLLLLGLLLLTMLALLTGTYPMNWYELLNEPSNSNVSSVSWVLFELRLPRVLSALCIGACLASSGAAYQGMFRNPLVSPDILGVAAGAGLGAVLAIFLSLNLFTTHMIVRHRMRVLHFAIVANFTMPTAAAAAAFWALFVAAEFDGQNETDHDDKKYGEYD